MTFSQAVSLVLSIISIVGTLYFGIRKVAQLELKVDTMWDFQMRRAHSEGINKGVFYMNSPLKLSPQVIAIFEPLAPFLRTYYETNGRGLNERELFIQIEHFFGDQITKSVCIPMNLQEGACLIAALEIARGTPASCEERPSA